MSEVNADKLPGRRSPPQDGRPERQSEQREHDRLDALLDEGLGETFPASDPVAVSSVDRRN